MKIAFAEYYNAHGNLPPDLAAMNLTSSSLDSLYRSGISMNSAFGYGMYFRMDGKRSTIGWTGPGNTIYVAMKVTSGTIQSACGLWQTGWAGSPDNKYLPYPCNKANVATFLTS